MCLRVFVIKSKGFILVVKWYILGKIELNCSPPIHISLLELKLSESFQHDKCNKIYSIIHK